METIKFTKMHGAGNDYIYVDCTRCELANPEKLSIEMSDRHKGIGADGLILIMPSDKADFRMRMFNADGSEGEMCGNASRCIAKYVYDHRMTNKRLVSLETKAGIKMLSLNVDDHGCLVDVTVDMGEPILENELIPVNSPADVIDYPIATSAGDFYITAVSMGNPHGVIFTDGVLDMDISHIGLELECHPLFPNKANIEFAQIDTRSDITMRVWERGSGETMACGTGACATVVAGVLMGRCDRSVNMKLLGGNLKIHWEESNNHVYMTGEAVTVFEGEYYINAIMKK